MVEHGTENPRAGSSILLLGIMLQKNTILLISDNSDAKKVLCIHKYKKKKLYKQSDIGSTFLGSVKKQVKRKNVIKVKINPALIVGVKKKKKRKSGEFFKSYKNRGILLDGNNKTLGSKIKIKIPKEIKTFNFLKKNNKTF